MCMFLRRRLRAIIFGIGTLLVLCYIGNGMYTPHISFRVVRDVHPISNDTTIKKDMIHAKGIVKKTMTLASKLEDLEDDAEIRSSEKDNIDNELSKKALPSSNEQLISNQGAFNGTATAVVLLTYMRSGSSLTGEVLQQGESTFYVYEPLVSLRMPTKYKPTISFLNGTIFKYGKYNVETVKYEALKGLLTCKFSRVFREVFTHKFMKYGKETKAFYNCLQKKEKDKDKNKTVTRLNYCLDFLKKNCLAAQYRLVKTIRTPMKMMEQLIKEVKKTKIVNLIRDPRSTVDSQKERNVCPSSTGGIVGCASRLCDQVYEDTLEKKRLDQIYPGRIHTVTYENMILEPVENSKNMFNFIGKTFTTALERYVTAMTTGKVARCSVCNEKWQVGKSKSNEPSQHIDSWKAKWHPRLITNIESLCRNVINAYGYHFA